MHNVYKSVMFLCKFPDLVENSDFQAIWSFQELPFAFNNKAAAGILSGGAEVSNFIHFLCESYGHSDHPDYKSAYPRYEALTYHYEHRPFSAQFSLDRGNRCHARSIEEAEDQKRYG